MELSNVLIVVDMQNDFIDGSLGSSDACNIVDNVCEKIKLYKDAGRPIYYTLDTHFNNYLDTFEGKRLPIPHCIRENYGWKLNSKINELLEGYGKPIEKITFGSTAWFTKDFITDTGAEITYIEGPENRHFGVYKGGSIEVCGLCTDICVVTNVLILRTVFPETEITVDASCCAGTTIDNHIASLNTMKSCQINVINEPCYDIHDDDKEKFDREHLLDIVPQVGKLIYVKFTGRSDKKNNVIDCPCEVINVDLENAHITLFPIKAIFDIATHSEAETKNYTAELTIDKYKYKVLCGIPTRDEIEKYINIVEFDSDFWVYDVVDSRYSYYISPSSKRVNASPNYLKYECAPILNIKLDDFVEVIDRKP